MSGLLDVLNTDEGRFGLGLLAAAGPRADGAGFGQRMMEGVGSVDAWKQNQAMQKMRDMQQQAMTMQMESAKRKAEQDARISAGMGQFFKPAQPALSPLMGDPSTGILPSAGRAAVAPSFDAAGASSFLAQNGDYESALKYMPKPKEAPINKLDVKDFTPASVAKFSQSGNYGDLIRMDKAHFQNTGGETMALDPFTGKPLSSVQNTQSPDSKASNAVSWANYGLAKDRLSFDKAGGAESVKAARPEWKDGQWVVPPKDMKPGETRSVTPQTNTKDARDALMIIGEAEKYIPDATGSGVGTGLDWVGRALGYSTKGDTAIGQLKALEGVLVSKMPKMSGPQSDKDVALYKQMAAEIGDPMMPNSRKKAALKVVKDIQTKYAAGGNGGATGDWGANQFRIISVE